MLEITNMVIIFAEFFVILLSPSTYMRAVHQIRLRSVPSTCFAIHRLSVIFPYDAVQPQLLTASLIYFATLPLSRGPAVA
jgi:hypothetical protein